MAEEASPTREELVALCEAAIVPMDRWHDRDSASAHEQVGRAWALLRAGAPFTVRTEGQCATDERTIWVDIEWDGFQRFEWGRDEGPRDHETFYIPTAARLAERSGRDWY